jgi:hypothetical protein
MILARRDDRAAPNVLKFLKVGYTALVAYRV